MHVLMIGTFTGKDFSALLTQEAAFVADVRTEGHVQDLYLKTDRSGPVLLLQDLTAAQAKQRMAGLPFIVHDIATFDYIELGPMQAPAPAPAS